MTSARKKSEFTAERSTPRVSKGNFGYAQTSPTTDTLLDSHLHEIFNKTFNSLCMIAPECDVFIALFAPHQPSRVKWARGIFSPYMETALNTARGPIAAALIDNEPISIFESSEFRRDDGTFQDLPEGSLALLPVGLAGDRSALIGFFQPASLGRPTEERLAALKGFSDLIELAASASDLSQDIQAQQLRMDLMREEMAEVQHFYRQFSSAISQCFWVLDLNVQRVLVVSDNFERVMGSSRRCLSEGLTGFMSLVYPDDRDRVLSQFHLQLGESLDIEFRVIDDLGELKWIWLRAFPIEEASGMKSDRMVLIADDVTDKKQDEERLRAQEAQLASRAKMIAVGELASGVAHEINNPLTVIVGKASELRRLAEKGQSDTQLVKDTAEKIQATSVRISQIISSLKALARRDRIQATQKTAFDQIFRELKDICSERFKAAGVDLEIPEFPESFGAEMNPTMISQMILNLLNNALDAVQGEKKKWVRVEFAEDQDSVFLYVTDSGSGIPIKIRSRIFDPFFTTKEPGRGTGLGLSLSAGIVAHHHGQLRYDHLHPHTRFVVQLPKKQTSRA